MTSQPTKIAGPPREHLRRGRVPTGGPVPPCLGDDDPPEDTLADDLAMSLALMGLARLGQQA